MGRFHLDRLIGRGTGSEVWRARRIDGTGPAVALKRGPAAAAEAGLLARIDHPAVVRLVAVEPDGRGVALVLPLVEGGTLEHLLVRRGRLAAGEVVAVAAAVADGLAAAHRAGVVHGDVKPANVLLRRDGSPVLADFGATAGRSAAGSAAYLDPRRLAGAPPDAAADVYGLAVVAHRALTGRLPHAGETDEDVLAAATRGARPDLSACPEIPEALARLLDDALALARERRPAGAAQFAAGLRASVRATEIRFPDPSAPDRTSSAPLTLVGGDTRRFGPQPPRAPAGPARDDRWSRRRARLRAERRPRPRAG